MARAFAGCADSPLPPTVPQPVLDPPPERNVTKIELGALLPVESNPNLIWVIAAAVAGSPMPLANFMLIEKIYLILAR
jgi:hypothetical protein